ncbi:MAG TPA: histidine kinase [Candidatus Atribacteria bacterium]|nr:histidine kinase [Candidatus Atribacteria bacterium]
MKDKKPLYIADRILISFIVTALLHTIILIYLFFTAVTFGTRLFLIVYIIAVTAVFYLSYEWIYKPYQESNKVLRLFSDGFILKGIFDLKVHFNHELSLAFQKFKEIIDTKELIEGSKKHAEYLALQNQINPHFLYNTLEGIRSDAIIAGLDSIANMTEALETFLRYTISDMDKLATLGEEIIHVENYCRIQRYRFGEKINFRIECHDDIYEEIMQARIPKLTLQPIVENAIFHGIELKIGNGTVTVKVVATRTRLLITVSDDGVGMEEEQVQLLNEKLRGASLTYIKEDKKKGGIALLNVNNRIKLLFGDEYGIYIYSKPGIGTDVEITLPIIR